MDDAKLVSVVIPCYNHSHHLQNAIDSICKQSYKNVEIIVVDDGSTDGTKGVAEHVPGVKYIYQNNQGLAAARNTGIYHSNGEFLVFLDADDILYENAIAINLTKLLQDKSLAFVSGSHDISYTINSVIQPVIKTVADQHYINLLKGNYIGMHATVMYRKCVCEEFLFDKKLKACEDYDVYLRVARKYSVLHHANIIAAYQLHDANMSNNIPLMLRSALKVLKQQEKQLKNAAELTAYKEGIENWKKYYVQKLEKKLQVMNRFSWEEFWTILRYDSQLTLGKLLKQSTIMFGSRLIHYIPGKSSKELLRALSPRKKVRTPAQGQVNFGDLDRLSPFSSPFGTNRGKSIEQFYLENFVGNQSLCIKGRVLEIGSDYYTKKFGGNNVTKSEVLNLDMITPNVTLEGQHSSPIIPDNVFDCIILPQTLPFIYNVKDALYFFYNILKPGGNLLLTVPGITPINTEDETRYWSFTDKAITKLLQETFPKCELDIYAFGNLYTATAFLYGMGETEISLDNFLYVDSHYQVTITAKATKIL